MLGFIFGCIWKVFKWAAETVISSAVEILIFG